MCLLLCSSALARVVETKARQCRLRKPRQPPSCHKPGSVPTLPLTTYISIITRWITYWLERVSVSRWLLKDLLGQWDSLDVLDHMCVLSYVVLIASNCICSFSKQAYLVPKFPFFLASKCHCWAKYMRSFLMMIHLLISGKPRKYWSQRREWRPRTSGENTWQILSHYTGYSLMILSWSMFPGFSLFFPSSRDQEESRVWWGLPVKQAEGWVCNCSVESQLYKSGQ